MTVSTPVARARDLVLRYGETTALRASSFEIPRGTITAIIGPNGSGKSTVLHAIAGLHGPASGRVEVLGTTPREARRRVSYVLQTTRLPAGTPISVREAVCMGRYPAVGVFGRLRSHDRARVRQALQRLDITDLAHRHLTELSGGQRQRVLVAQGIVQDHEVLLLDEPLTGLDLVSAQTIDAIIHGERDAGGSVVITTHDLDEARAADHVLLMSGHVVASGPPEQVLTRANLEHAYGLGALHEPSLHFFDDPAHTVEGDTTLEADPHTRAGDNPAGSR